MTEKPKPLDLEEIKKKIFERFCEELFGTKKPRDITEWSDIGKIGGEHGIDAEEIEELVEFTINETLQRIRKACEFYLRYKDKPSVLWNERINYIKKIKKGKELWKFIEKLNKERCITLRLYNEWLFKLTFRGVFGEKNG